MRFKLKNSNIFPMPNSRGRLLHLGTIEYGLREFVVMLSPQDTKIYIEEVVLNTVNFSEDVYANCKFIDDDNLFNDLTEFVNEQKLTDMSRVVERATAQGRSSWIIGS